ncbi:MAG TPA: hypothetical protein VF493_05810 [Terriglobales bacterium]
MTWKITIHILLWWGALLGLPSLYAAELKPETAQAFDAYLRSYEKNSPLSAGEFLSVDHQFPALRAQSYERLRGGEVLIEHREPPEDRFSGALLHHWVGTAFFPGATLDEVFAVLEDYKSYQATYAPEVVQARILERKQDDFKVELRLRKHKVVTVLLDTDYDVRFQHIDASHGYSRSYSTRIAEIEHPGEASERELPPGNDHGFLWRLNTYWRFVEKDGGVYAQCESISLTRDVPSGLGWLVGKFVESIPRESLVFTLNSTGKALARQQLRAAETNNDQTRDWR